MTQKYLVLVETSGNQAYVFATNKLRDVLGASQRIWQAGYEFVRGGSEIIRQAGTDYVVDALECLTSKGRIVVATSGKALLLFDKKEDATAFVTAWSKKLLLEAPGLDGTGVVSSVMADLSASCGDDSGIAIAVKRVHQEFEVARAWRRSPEARFARLPIVAPCAVSGRPANAVDSVGGEEILVSAPVKAKRDIVKAAKRRLDEELHEGLGITPFNDIDEMERKTEDLEWLAVIHADGNGLGEIFLKFHEYVGTEETGEDYIKSYAGFSQALDDICREAYREAVRSVFKDKLSKASGIKMESENSRQQVPIIPIVVAGDDLTAIIDGRKALAFTEVFIKEFCKRTGDASHAEPHRRCLAEIVKNAERHLGAPRLGMAAGVCICKPHFPFSTAYSLAEQLMRNAKKVKTELNRASAAMDFHIMYDSSASTIDAIRDKLRIGDRILTGKPFVIDAVGNTEGNSPVEHDEWFKKHDWVNFQRAVSALQAQNGRGRALLPSSQAHAVREMLFRQDVPTQEAEWKLLLGKYEEFKKNWGINGEWQLYRGGAGESTKYTLFLDAIEAASFYDTL